jgi:A/G-specific adenine glycosylase
VFTHFPLELIVLRADLPQATAAPEGTYWISIEDIAGAALPSVMRKVLAHALRTFGDLERLRYPCEPA